MSKFFTLRGIDDVFNFLGVSVWNLVSSGILGTMRASCETRHIYLQVQRHQTKELRTKMEQFYEEKE